MKYRDLLIFLFGVILLIVGLWVYRRTSTIPIMEGMADTGSIVMVAIASTVPTAGAVSGKEGTVYYADVGLTNIPNWKSVTGTLTQVSGSKGQLIGVDKSNVVWFGTQYSVPGSPFKWTQIPSKLSQVSYDYPLAVGLNSADNKVYFLDNVSSSGGSFKQVAGAMGNQQFQNIAVSIGRGYGVSLDKKSLFFCENIRGPTWIDVTKNLTGSTFTQVVFESNAVAVLCTNGTVWYADSKIETAPTWAQIAGQPMKQISMRNRMGSGIGIDGVSYFSTEFKKGAWNKIAIPKDTSLLQIELIYPKDVNMITERPATATPCDAGYEMIVGLCYSLCSVGRISNYSVCSGVPVNRDTRPVTVVPPTTLKCPDGFDVNLNTTASCVGIVKGDLSPTTPSKEVYGFGIKSGQVYTQEQAKAKCLSFGAELATLDQLTTAQKAGASWCTWGWLKDQTKKVFSANNTAALQAWGMTFPTNCGGLGISSKITEETITIPEVGYWLYGAYFRQFPARTQTNVYITAAAGHCYGVKPPQGQFDDIYPFKPDGTWNQATQCPFGYNVAVTGTCYSTCPTGFFPSAGSCLGLTTPKTGGVPYAVGYNCPTGYDTTASATQSTCFETCPEGYSPDLNDISVCVGNTTTPAESKVAVQTTPTLTGLSSGGFGFSYSCPAGYSKYVASAFFTYCVKCDAGFSPFGLTCYTSCPQGSELVNSSGNVVCRINTKGTWFQRKTVAGTLKPSCEPGMVKVAASNTCFPACPAGATDNTLSCTTTTAARKTTVTIPNASKLTMCNANEDIFPPDANTGGLCVKKCDDGYITSPKSCVKPDESRKSYPVTFSCNSNETLVSGGICVSKCPAGTFPDGELCIAEEQVVPAPSSIQCTSSPLGSYKKWMCDTSDMAAALLKDPSPTTTYVSPKDQVCVSDDPSTNMYYCQSGEEAKIGTEGIDRVREDHNDTCAKVTKNYLDLSNNITTLLLIQSGMTTGSSQLQTAATALTSIYGQLNCATPVNAQVADLCKEIQTSATNVGADSTNVSSALTNITGPIQAALTARTSLLSSISNFKCAI